MTLSDWPAIKTFLSRLEKDEGKAAYEHLLGALAGGQFGNPGMMPGGVQMMNGMPMQMQMQPQQYMMERNKFGNQDVIDLASVAPEALEQGQIDQLGQILRQSLDQGNTIEDLGRAGSPQLKKPGKEAALSQRQAAKLLFAANCPVEAGQFLPEPDKAVKDDDREALNLLARHYLALHAATRRPFISSRPGRSRRRRSRRARSTATRRMRRCASG